MNTSVSYVSESFWSGNTFLTLLILLFMFVVMFAVMSIPAIIAGRHNDKKQMAISLVCALTGMFLLIPWIVSVIIVSKKYDMSKKREGAVPPQIYTLFSLIQIGIGGAILYRNYVEWESLSGISLILYGVALLVASLLNGKGYWVAQMLAAPMLLSCIRPEYTEALYRIYEIVSILSALLIIYNAAGSPLPAFAAQRAAKAARSQWADQTVLGIRKEKTAEKTAEKAVHPREAEKADSKTTAEDQKGAGKMKLERCSRGHFYDRAKYGDNCPYCISAQQSAAAPTPENAAPAKAEDEKQAAACEGAPVSTAHQPTAPEEMPTAVQTAQPVKDQAPAKPSMPAARKRSQPVVGWLVCIKGVYRGESFTLKAGRNFIGRSADMDVCLHEDSSIADAKQAAIIYEPRSRQFILMPGDVHELCYINNEVALSSTPINAYDCLDIGDTSLLLIPCCGERFSWEDGPAK